MNTFKSVSIILLTIVLSACGDFWYTDVRSKVGPTTSNPATGNPNTPSDPEDPNNPNPPHVMAWTHPADLNSHVSIAGTNTWLPKVAMDNNGNAVMAWYQYDGSKNQIFMSEYRNGAWSNPVSLADNISPDGQYAYWPEVAMDNNGNAIIVWYQYNGSHYQVFKSEYRNGTWTHPASLADNISPDGQNTYGAKVVMSDSSDAIITWYQFSGTHNQIYKSEYRNGVWTHPANLADHISLSGQIAGANHAAIDSSGNTIIVWHQRNGVNNQIFKSEYRNGVWTHPANVNDNISPDGAEAGYPNVAMDDNGNAIITWQQAVGVNSQVFKSEYRNNTWTHPANLADNISPDGQNVNYPIVKMDNLGNAIVVWQQSDGAFGQIFKSEYRDGVWAHPANLSDNISPDGSLALSPQVAMDDNGNALVTWEQSNALIYEIFKSEYREGEWVHPTSTAEFISPAGQHAASSQIAMSNNGEAVIVWSQSNGTHTQIFRSEYR
jgi:hypothetical protein